MADTTNLNLAEQAQLIQALQTPHCFPHAVAAVEVIETHISWVLLAGDFAYKIKKNVNFGFLNFSTLASRHQCCDAELRLNQRQAADLYIAVVPLTGSVATPMVGGDGPILEYAVKMRRFSQASLLDQRLAAGQVEATQIDLLAQTLVDFHRSVAKADSDSPYGGLEQIMGYTRENCRVAMPLLSSTDDQKRLHDYSVWIEQQHKTLADVFAARKRDGYIRECHGDLHVRNITLDGTCIHFFDCIEFNPALRWIDVVSELAFLAMDLDASGQQVFSHRLLNSYFEATGDYAGVTLLPYYLAYRAMVRAKVALLRLPQEDSSEQQNTLRQKASHYVGLAWHYSMKRTSAVILTHGLSGSGKSTHTFSLVEILGALRLRSDVERKRLFGFDTNGDAQSAVNSGIYTPEATRKTYAYLVQQASSLIAAGFPVIIDATSLKRWQRDIFRDLAKSKNVPFVLVDFNVDVAELERRIQQRQTQGNDASDATIAVLHQQLKNREPLADDEIADTFAFPVMSSAEYKEHAWHPLLQRLEIFSNTIRDS